ncbi:Ig-like domain-containing protein [Sporosarcina jiandibaonis]|uniref:Ig-like domain-containing protein n=1 Tax=Sporosarcina jiandibaonis TaxID=2715535 RepID=UPI0015527FFC|nr:Ig-like domain-containing protein [Sporosarcina jiandibaonis]
MKKKIISVVASALLMTTAFSGSVFANSLDPLKNKIELPGTEESSKDFRNFNPDHFKLPQIPQTLNKNGVSGFSYNKTAESDILYETEPNDYIEEANSLPMNKGMVGAFQWEEDIDLYKVKATSTDYMVVFGATLDEYPYMGLAYGVFDSNLDYVEPEVYEYEDENGIYFQIVPVKPGDYYILAMDYYELGSNELYLLMAQMLDTKAPSAPTVNAIDDNDTSISGIAEKNSTVTIKNGSTVLGKPKANSSGNFKLTIKKIKAGSKITATATDEAGNVSKATTVTVKDKTAPGAPKVNAVDDNDKSVSGKAEANSTVTVKNGKKTLGSPKVDKSGKFKLTIKSVKAGTKLTFTAKDASGNVSKATTVTVADKTAPSLTLKNIYSTTKTATGKTEAGAKLTFKVGKTTIGSGTANAKGDFKIAIKRQKKNTTITVTVSDKAKNTKKVTTKVK